MIDLEEMAFMVVGTPEWDGLKVTCGLGRSAPPAHVIARILRSVADNLESGAQ